MNTVEATDAVTDKTHELAKDPRSQVFRGDALAIVRSLPDRIADVCVTGPPYWSLRDYGVARQLGLEATPDEYVSQLSEAPEVRTRAA